MADEQDKSNRDEATERGNEPEEPAAQSRPSRWRRWRWKVALLVGSTFVGLLLAELTLRLFYEPPEYDWYPRYTVAKDPFVGARFAPNLRLKLTFGAKEKRYSFTTNSLGFRSREIREKKPRGTFRILFVGDSFTEGFGVGDQETLPYYFEKIARQMDKSIEVINAGHSGYELRDYDWFLNGYIRRLCPDLVIVSVYAGNDLTPVAPKDRYHPRLSTSYGLRCGWDESDRIRSNVENRWIFVCSPDSPGAAIDRWLHRHSYLYRIASDHLLRFDLVRLWLQEYGWIEEMPEKVPTFIGRMPSYQFLTSAQSRTARDLQEGRRYLENIRLNCEATGVDMFVQVIPSSIPLPRFEAVWEFLVSKWRGGWEAELGRPLRPGDIDKSLMNRRVANLVAESGIASIDLTPLAEIAMRFDEFHQLDYGAHMAHFSANDCLFSALVLLDTLIERGRLPSSLTHDGLLEVWARDYANVRPPFAAPKPPEPSESGGAILVEGFQQGFVRSSLEDVPRSAAKAMKGGWFTPLLDVEAGVRSVHKDDFIEYVLPLAAAPASTRRTLVMGICHPATAKDLDRAVWQSVRFEKDELWSRDVGASVQGMWSDVVLDIPASDEASTLTVRVEATRDFEEADVGEFPLVLRLRRLRLYTFNAAE